MQINLKVKLLKFTCMYVDKSEINFVISYSYVVRYSQASGFSIRISGISERTTRFGEFPWLECQISHTSELIAAFTVCSSRFGRFDCGIVLLWRMIDPKNNNFHFEPVQHLKMFNTWTLQDVQVFKMFQVFKRLKMF